jgi:hypothetical protein
VIHAYYAIFLECRDALTRWQLLLPRQSNIHHAVRLKFQRSSDTEIQRLGDILYARCRLRNIASYDLRGRQEFTNDTAAQETIQAAVDGLAVLDAIDADPARRAAVIASLPP